MGSGHLHIRKLLKSETTWIDKRAPKHKHDFIMPYILEERSPDNQIEFYNIMKCDKCMSFKSVAESGNIQGWIFNDLTKEQKSFPKLIANKKHKNIIGFDDILDVQYYKD